MSSTAKTPAATPRYRLEPHALHERIHGKLLFLLAWPSLVVAMRRRFRRTELWIGDSHTLSVNRRVTNSMFMRGPEGQLILRGGAKLMFSLARDGFPARVVRVARFVNRFGRPDTLVPIFSAGDIDVRAHLPGKPDARVDFADAYVDRCLEIAGLLKATRVGFLVPPPPVDARPEEVWFPITGTIEERLDAQRKLVDALVAAVDSVPNAFLIDLTELLAGPEGGMPVELTIDGAHLGGETIALVRAHIATLGLLED